MPQNERRITTETSEANARFVKFVEDIDYGEFHCIVRHGSVVQTREARKDRRFDIQNGPRRDA